MSALFKPFSLGAIEIKNRVLMAPLTRGRASGTDGRTPNELMAEQYVQRAGAGLIFTEATSIMPMGVGYANTPGIWSEDHVRGWKNITDAVHKAGGKIVLQLWHVGRISHPMFLNGETPVAPSAIKPKGHVSLVRPETEYPTPRALETDEIPAIVEAYRKGAENAKRAGFDGVEIHGANGYLVDQFLQDSSNHRTDQYGGSIENRARFMMEVADAAISVWGSERVGMHLSPRGDAHSVGDTDLEALFTYVAEQLNKRKLAFLCVRESVGPDSLVPKMRKIFKGAIIGNEKYTRESAEKAVAAGDVDAVAWGKLYIANPDLARRFELNAELNEVQFQTFYAEGAIGYTDQPFLRERT